MNQITKPELTPAAWLEQAIGVLALRLRHEVSLTRALRGPDRQEGFLGLFLSDKDAEILLDELSGRLAAEVPNSGQLDQLQASLSVTRTADTGGIWYRLATTCDLTEIELDLLLLVAAPALDPRFGRVYGYLNDDMARRHLTPALALRLLDRHGPDLLSLRAMFAVTAPLSRHRLITFGPAQPFIESAIRIDESVLDRLLGQSPPERTIPIHKSGHYLPAVALIRHCDDPGPQLVQLAAGSALDLRLIEGDNLAPDSAPEQIADSLRDARLSGALPVLLDNAALPAERIAPLLTAPCLICTKDPGRWHRHGLTEQPIAGHLPDRQTTLERIAATESKAAQLAKTSAHIPILTLLSLYDTDLSPQTTARAISGAAEDRLGKLATHVTSPFCLDDIIVPGPTRDALKNLIYWQSTATTVLQDWGLGETFNKRHALISLFSGPSGTGKTMAASVIANALSLPLYHIDLASMVSKYIGETEKNLDRLFSAAESTQVVLFFDEADAIFGQRSEVSDAHDRYANLETSYLLQRMETFRGISILASNLAQNMDEAFLRRIDSVVEFPAPGVVERCALWNRIKATNAPLAEDLDLNYLAERFELTGGEIRNCWLAAAHIAAHDGAAIDMGRLMRAIAGELTKQSKAIRRSDFGQHYTALRASGSV